MYKSVAKLRCTFCADALVKCGASVPHRGTRPGTTRSREHQLDLVEDTALDVAFRAHAYPKRRFGWRSWIWPATPPHDDDYGTINTSATLLPTHLEETINTIAYATLTPDQNGVEWLIELRS